MSWVIEASPRLKIFEPLMEPFPVGTRVNFIGVDSAIGTVVERRVPDEFPETIRVLWDGDFSAFHYSPERLRVIDS